MEIEIWKYIFWRSQIENTSLKLHVKKLPSKSNDYYVDGRLLTRRKRVSIIACRLYQIQVGKAKYPIKASVLRCVQY